MNELLARIIKAHGTIDRWKSFEKVEITIVSGGSLFSLKGRPQDSAPDRMTVWLHEEPQSRRMVQGGGFGGAQLTSNYIQVNGIGLPSKRRR
jgi:hypothetical protein